MYTSISEATETDFYDSDEKKVWKIGFSIRNREWRKSSKMERINIFWMPTMYKKTTETNFHNEKKYSK